LNVLFAIGVTGHYAKLNNKSSKLAEIASFDDL
jgi:hypothetical protein